METKKAIEQLESLRRYCHIFPDDKECWSKDIEALGNAIDTLKNKDSIDKLSKEEKSWHEGYIELDCKVKNAATDIYNLKDLIMAYGKEIRHKQIIDTLKDIEGALKK